MPELTGEDAEDPETFSGAILLLIGSEEGTPVVVCRICALSGLRVDCVHSVYRPDTVLTNNCWCAHASS